CPRRLNPRRSQYLDHSRSPDRPRLVVDTSATVQEVLLRAEVEVGASDIENTALLIGWKVVEDKLGARTARFARQFANDLSIPTGVLGKGLEPQLIAQAAYRDDDGHERDDDTCDAGKRDDERH